MTLPTTPYRKRSSFLAWPASMESYSSFRSESESPPSRSCCPSRLRNGELSGTHPKVMLLASRFDGLSTNEDRRLARSGRLETGMRRVTPGKRTEPLARGTRGILMVLESDPILYRDGLGGKDADPVSRSIRYQ